MEDSVMRIIFHTVLVICVIGIICIGVRILPQFFAEIKDIQEKAKIEDKNVTQTKTTNNQNTTEKKTEETKYTVNKETNEVTVPIEKEGNIYNINIKIDNIENINEIDIDKFIQSIDIDNIENVENFNVDTLDDVLIPTD